MNTPEFHDPVGARQHTDLIRNAVEDVWNLVTMAYEGRIWLPLGYDSWDTYCAEELGSSRISLPREERSEVVASLRDSGLSIRAIAAATGTSVGTVHGALAGVQNRTPANESAADDPAPEPRPVVGLDGKNYAPTAPRPAPNPDAPPAWNDADLPIEDAELDTQVWPVDHHEWSDAADAMPEKPPVEVVRTDEEVRYGIAAQRAMTKICEGLHELRTTDLATVADLLLDFEWDRWMRAATDMVALATRIVEADEGDEAAA